MRRALALLCALTGALTAASAGADDAALLLKLLQRAQRQELRGQVVSSVYFPPRPNPDRRLNTLPAVRFVPWLLKKNFDVTLAGSDRVADRDAQRYELSPKAGSGARWTLWLDLQTQLPLGFAERGADGTLVRQAQFVKVNGGAKRRLSPLVSVPRDPSFRAAVLAALPGLKIPKGFEPISYQQRDRGPEVVLSDGVNVLALVIAGRPVKPAPGVAVRPVGAGWLWLVGNLPQGELDAALKSVRSISLDALGTFSPDSVSQQ